MIPEEFKEYKTTVDNIIFDVLKYVRDSSNHIDDRLQLLFMFEDMLAGDNYACNFPHVDVPDEEWGWVRGSTFRASTVLSHYKEYSELSDEKLLEIKHWLCDNAYGRYTYDW